MPPKSDIWRFFEELKDTNGKTVKYLSDKSHACAWCAACLDECVHVRHSQELVNVEKGELSRARGKDELRKTCKLSNSAIKMRSSIQHNDIFQSRTPGSQCLPQHGSMPPMSSPTTLASYRCVGNGRPWRLTSSTAQTMPKPCPAVSQVLTPLRMLRTFPQSPRTRAPYSCFPGLLLVPLL